MEELPNSLLLRYSDLPKEIHIQEWFKELYSAYE